MVRTSSTYASRSSSSSAEADKRGYLIESLARGLQVLEGFSAERPELALKDIAAAAGVTAPSAVRISHTLTELGYLVRNPVTKGYRLGPKVVAVGMATLNSMTLPELAEPFLVDLRNRTHETVKLAIHTGPVIVFIARIPSRLHPSNNQYVGTSLPIHASSMGRAILAFLPEEEANRLIDESADVRLTSHTPTKDEVRRALPGIRQRGYELNDQAVTLENRAVAAPLLDAYGVAVGAINISISAQRISAKDLERKMAPLVVETAKQISGILPLTVQGAGWARPTSLVGD